MQTFAHHRSRSPQRVRPATVVPAPRRALDQSRQLRHLLGRSAVQAKLRVSAPNDPLEIEADRTADAVMRMPARGAGIGLGQTAPSVQRVCAECEEEVQAKRMDSDLTQRQTDEGAEEEEELVQPKSKDPAGKKSSAAASVERGIGAGQPLPVSVRAFFEPRFGNSFDQVRIHTDTAAQVSSEALNARAFTYGSDIVFGPGEYRPETPDGQRLIAHELAHTVQQGKSAPLVQREVREGMVSCRNPSDRVRKIVGDDPVATIRAADARAIEMLDNVIEELDSSRASVLAGEPASWPNLSDRLGAALRDRFGLDPNNEEIWTGTGAGTVHVIAKRFRAVRGLLSSGFIKYRCLATGRIDTSFFTGKGCEEGDWAFSFAGESHVFLCKPWWKDSRDEQANTLVHEALHIYFPHINDKGHLTNAHCYDQFLSDLNDAPIPLSSQGFC